MLKNKVVILMLSILFMACLSNKHFSSKQQENIFGKYSYKTSNNTFYISFELKPDSTFVFEQSSGMENKYSEGHFKLTATGDIIISSVYDTSQGPIPRVTWKNFNNRTLVFEKNKILYENYKLQKQ